MCVLVCCVVRQMEAGQRLSGADILRLVSSVLVSQSNCLWHQVSQCHSKTCAHKSLFSMFSVWSPCLFSFNLISARICRQTQEKYGS